ncbi:hypothetical protein JOC34_001511 [Virgibacillus halotolerans]|nr:hypothetical protein [Virgibacillus halotolerans]
MMNRKYTVQVRLLIKGVYLCFIQKKLMKNLSSFVGRIIDTISYLYIVLIGIMNYNKSIGNIYLKKKITSMVRSPNFGI